MVLTDEQRPDSDQEPQIQQPPVVIRQGSGGLATVLAALLIACLLYTSPSPRDPH